MRIFEGQALGGLMLLLGAMTIYGIFLFNDRQPARESPIPWGYQESGVMAVEVSGDAGRAGIYFLPEGTTIGQMGEMGLIPRMPVMGGLAFVRIYDGALLDISAKGDVKPSTMGGSAILALGLPVDINRVTEEELTRIPGIGERMASRIIQLRRQKGTFRDLSELMAIPGIKETKLNGLRKYLTITAAP